MKRLLMVSAFCISIMLIGSAMAIVAGNNGTADPSNPNFTTTVGPDGVIEFGLGDVEWGLNGGPIIKHIYTNGATIITVVETMHVSGFTPWTDWDEQLMVRPEGQDHGWVVSPDSDMLEWSGQVDVVGAGTGWGWFDDEPIDLLVIGFNPPVLPSTDLTITKTILNSNMLPEFQIWQWPTVPEPSILLMAMGLLLLRFRRK